MIRELTKDSAKHLPSYAGRATVKVIAASVISHRFRNVIKKRELIPGDYYGGQSGFKLSLIEAHVNSSDSDK